jgi:lysyl-tRNA synthetase class 2
MNFVEEMIKNIIKELDLNHIIPVEDKDGKVKKVDFNKKWKRINYVDLIKKDSGIDINEVKEVKELKKLIKKKKIDIPDMNKMGYATLVDYLYKKVSRPKIVGPAFLYNYPKAIQPLARTNDKNEDMVDQFQLVINGWEMLKGYSELVDSIDQKERFQEQDKEKKAGDEEAMEGDDDYILAMEHGMPPISGVGLGIDRLVTILSQQNSLRDTVFFPLMRPKKDK